MKKKLFVAAAITGLVVATGGLAGVLLLEGLLVSEVSALACCVTTGLSTALLAASRID